MSQLSNYRGSWWAVRDFVVALVLLGAALIVLFLLLVNECAPSEPEVRRLDFTNNQQRAFTIHPDYQVTEEVIEVSDDLEWEAGVRMSGDASPHGF